jgi:hypothetical protein
MKNFYEHKFKDDRDAIRRELKTMPGNTEKKSVNRERKHIPTALKMPCV